MATTVESFPPLNRSQPIDLDSVTGIQTEQSSSHSRMADATTQTDVDIPPTVATLNIQIPSQPQQLAIFHYDPAWSEDIVLDQTTMDPKMRSLAGAHRPRPLSNLIVSTPTTDKADSVSIVSISLSNPNRLSVHSVVTSSPAPGQGEKSIYFSDVGFVSMGILPAPTHTTPEELQRSVVESLTNFEAKRVMPTEDIPSENSQSTTPLSSPLTLEVLPLDSPRDTPKDLPDIDPNAFSLHSPTENVNLELPQPEALSTDTPTNILPLSESEMYISSPQVFQPEATSHDLFDNTKPKSEIQNDQISVTFEAPSPKVINNADLDDDLSSPTPRFSPIALERIDSALSPDRTISEKSKDSKPEFQQSIHQLAILPESNEENGVTAKVDSQPISPASPFPKIDNDDMPPLPPLHEGNGHSNDYPDILPPALLPPLGIDLIQNSEMSQKLEELVSSWPVLKSGYLLRYDLSSVGHAKKNRSPPHSQFSSGGWSLVQRHGRSSSPTASLRTNRKMSITSFTSTAADVVQNSQRLFSRSFSNLLGSKKQPFGMRTRPQQHQHYQSHQEYPHSTQDSDAMSIMSQHTVTHTPSSVPTIPVHSPTYDHLLDDDWNVYYTEIRGRYMLFYVVSTDNTLMSMASANQKRSPSNVSNAAQATEIMFGSPTSTPSLLGIPRPRLTRGREGSLSKVFNVFNKKSKMGNAPTSRRMSIVDIGIGFGSKNHGPRQYQPSLFAPSTTAPSVDDSSEKSRSSLESLRSQQSVRSIRTFSPLDHKNATKTLVHYVCLSNSHYKEITQAQLGQLLHTPTDSETPTYILLSPGASKVSLPHSIPESHQLQPQTDQMILDIVLWNELLFNVQGTPSPPSAPAPPPNSIMSNNFFSGGNSASSSVSLYDYNGSTPRSSSSSFRSVGTAQTQVTYTESPARKQELKEWIEGIEKVLSYDLDVKKSAEQDRVSAEVKTRTLDRDRDRGRDVTPKQRELFMGDPQGPNQVTGSNIHAPQGPLSPVRSNTIDQKLSRNRYFGSWKGETPLFGSSPPSGIPNKIQPGKVNISNPADFRKLSSYETLHVSNIGEGQDNGADIPENSTIQNHPYQQHNPKNSSDKATMSQVISSIKDMTKDVVKSDKQKKEKEKEKKLKKEDKKEKKSEKASENKRQEGNGSIPTQSEQDSVEVVTPGRFLQGLNKGLNKALLSLTPIVPTNVNSSDPAASVTQPALVKGLMTGYFQPAGGVRILRSPTMSSKSSTLRRRVGTPTTSRPPSGISQSTGEMSMSPPLVAPEIPLTLRKCISLIEEIGLDTEGLYRVSGSAATVDRLRRLFEADASKVVLYPPASASPLISALSSPFISDFTPSLSRRASRLSLEETMSSARSSLDMNAPPSLEKRQTSTGPKPPKKNFPPRPQQVHQPIPQQQPQIPQQTPQAPSFFDFYRSHVKDSGQQNVTKLATAGSALYDNDVHVVTGVVKAFLRSGLPPNKEPLCSFSSYESFIDAIKIEDWRNRMIALQDLVHALPPLHFATLKFVCDHLRRVSQHAQTNKMTIRNLAIIFGQTLLKPPPELDTTARMMEDMHHQCAIAEVLIDQAEWIFGPIEFEEEPLPEGSGEELGGEENLDVEGFDGGVYGFDEYGQIGPYASLGRGSFRAASPAISIPQSTRSFITGQEDRLHRKVDEVVVAVHEVAKMGPNVGLEDVQMMVAAVSSNEEDGKSENWSNVGVVGIDMQAHFPDLASIAPVVTAQIPPSAVMTEPHSVVQALNSRYPLLSHSNSRKNRRKGVVDIPSVSTDENSGNVNGERSLDYRNVSPSFPSQPPNTPIGSHPGVSQMTTAQSFFASRERNNQPPPTPPKDTSSNTLITTLTTSQQATVASYQFHTASPLSPSPLSAQAHAEINTDDSEKPLPRLKLNLDLDSSKSFLEQ